VSKGPWYQTCGNTEGVFAEMRKIDEMSLEYDRTAMKTQAPHGTIAVGPASFDYFIKAEVCRAFLRALRNGQDPKSASDYASVEARKAVEIHNAKSPKDHYWRVDVERGQDMIPHLDLRITQAGSL